MSVGEKRLSRKARKRRNQAYYITVYIKIARDGMPVTEQLMASIKSPTYKKHITETLFKRMVDPEGLKKHVFNLYDTWDCACFRYQDALHTFTPLASRWDPPSWLLQKYRDRIPRNIPSNYMCQRSLYHWAEAIVIDVVISAAVVCGVLGIFITGVGCLIWSIWKLVEVL